jgi:two-component system OmpR family sensor kinase/two-component system sensor histidine kinase BaeS
MGRLRSLRVKLALGFLLVAVSAVGLVAVMANRATTRQFEVYVSQGKQRRAEQLAPEFAAYYQRMGSWSGVEAWMAGIQSAQGGGQRRGQGGPAGVGSGTERLLLADPDGRLIADSAGALVGVQLSATEQAFGVPVEVGGNLVGILLVTLGATVHEGLEAQFLAEVNRSFWLAGLLASGLALLLGLLLARHLTAPLRALTEAAGRLAGPIAPEAVPQVRVRGGDEIAGLGLTFNYMARSLAHQEALRRNLLADLAHELRTPLSVMRGDLEAILDGVYAPSVEVLASLHEETLLMGRLVDDLRALAQAEAGQLRLERQPTDLGELLQGMLPGFECAAGPDPGPIFCLDLAPDLPLVDVDRQRVRQVVANLVSNALRHAPDSTRVVVSAVPRGGGVQVSVADDGPGIPAEDLPRVFDRFWRGNRAAVGSEGSGLGLAIARELVLAHGTEIWAESSPGRGTTFHFTLPLAGEQPAARIEP